MPRNQTKLRKLFKSAAKTADKLPGTDRINLLLLELMATRLLSFLGDVEEAFLKQAASSGLSWTTSRMVNYHHGLARLVITPAVGSAPTQMRGAIFLQSFELANGSHCSKASLNWHGVEAFPVISVYAKPNTDWKAEAARIAAAWLAGHAAAPEVTETPELSPLVAQAS